MAELHPTGLLQELQQLATLDTTGWSEPWRTLVGAPLNIVITVGLALLLRWFVHRVIDRFARESMERHESRLAALRGVAGRLIAETTGLSNERHQARTATTASLLKSISTLVISAVAILTVLSIIGIPLAPLLASAGVGGVALGIGAQSLVRDFLAGIFMIVEDQYGVGDVVDTSTVVGVVEEVSLRVTRIRAPDGVIWYVRNGEILRLGNRSQGYANIMIDVQTEHTVDPVRAKQVMADAVAGMCDATPWSEMLLEEPTISGPESLAGGLMALRVTVKSRAKDRDDVGRELRQRMRGAYEAAGLPLAVPPYEPTNGNT